LDYLCQFLWLDRKVETGWFQLWKDCLAWVQEALDRMVTYCKNDVAILEELYTKLRPYHWFSHPNANVKTKWLVCWVCGSDQLVLTKKPYRTQINSYDTYRCVCGALTKWQKRQ
jgi:hypothetical protein